MQEDVEHEVVTPLHIDNEDWFPPSAMNDGNYRKYTRQLRKYDRVAWTYHKCDWCTEWISPGQWYEARVILHHPGKLVSPNKKWRVRIEVEKRHYPLCPHVQRDEEEEMRREWENEDRAALEAEGKRA